MPLHSLSELLGDCMLRRALRSVIVLAASVMLAVVGLNVALTLLASAPSGNLVIGRPAKDVRVAQPPAYQLQPDRQIVVATP